MRYVYLGHSSSVTDLMHQDVDSSTAFVGEGDVKALRALYGGLFLSEYFETTTEQVAGKS